MSRGVLIHQAQDQGIEAVRPGAGPNPPTSRASLLIRHGHAGIVSPHGSLQLRGINLFALCPRGEIGWPIRWISAPSLEHTGVDRLVDVDVSSVVSDVRVLADDAVKRPRNPLVRSVGEQLIRVGSRRFHGITIEFDFRSEREPL